MKVPKDDKIQIDEITIPYKIGIQHKQGHHSKLNSVKGMLFMVVAAIFAAGQLFLSKLLLRTSSITSFEISYWNGFTLLILFGVSLLVLRIDIFEIPKQARYPLLIRGIAGASCNAFAILALSYISLSKGQVMIQTISIFTALLSRFALNERLSFYDWGACMLAFFGVVLVLNPFQVNQKNDQDKNELIGMSIALFAAFLGGITFISIRKIANQVHFMIPPFAFAIGNLFLSPLLILIKTTFSSSPVTLNTYSYYDIGILIAISFCIYGGLACQTLAFKYEKAGRVAPINYLQVLIAAILDMIIFNSFLKPYQVVGAILIVGSNLTISLLKCFNVIK